MASQPIRDLEPADVPETAALLAHAMDDDPAYGFLFPAAARCHGLTDLFARNLRTHLPYRCTSVLTEDGHIVGTVTLRPPGGIPISVLTMLRRGLIPFGAAHGLGAVRRLFALKRVYDDLEEAMVAGAPHWLVHMMAITPAKQGRGLGSRLVGAVLGARTR
jgi:predicted N-acetyltransferase YhbS